jgi:hypothetical protein
MHAEPTMAYGAFTPHERDQQSLLTLKFLYPS